MRSRLRVGDISRRRTNQEEPRVLNIAPGRATTSARQGELIRGRGSWCHGRRVFPRTVAAVAREHGVRFKSVRSFKKFTAQLLREVAHQVGKAQDIQMAQGRILVVEDEPLIRMFMLDTLSDAGFQAEEAASAGEALAKIAAETPPFAAVVIDIGLPDQSGDVLADALRVKWRGLPIIVASGHDRNEIARRFHHDRHISVLAKPYNSGMLVEALRNLGVLPAAA